MPLLRDQLLLRVALLQVLRVTEGCGPVMLLHQLLVVHIALKTGGTVALKAILVPIRQVVIVGAQLARRLALALVEKLCCLRILSVDLLLLGGSAFEVLLSDAVHLPLHDFVLIDEFLVRDGAVSIVSHCVLLQGARRLLLANVSLVSVQSRGQYGCLPLLCVAVKR